MPSELPIIKGVGSGPMVKRVKGKLYVYKYVRLSSVYLDFQGSAVRGRVHDSFIGRRG